MGETKKVPLYNDEGAPVFTEVEWTTPAGNTVKVTQQEWTTAVAVGGEPVLTEDFAVYTVINEDTGLPEENPLTGDIFYLAPTPSQCTQPIASYVRWGDISTVTEMDHNLIPLTKIYDPTWGRTECDVGVGTIDEVTGEITVDPWFVFPGTTWEDELNGVVTYVDGVLWSELIQEVGFGRLNISRSPEAVLQASFDEAINSINSALAIEIDASGRLLLTKQVYSDEVDPATGYPEETEETYVKAIDSPLENLALYVKLLQDGHLVTPGDERMPLDRSLNGGIPLWKLIELEDGPSQGLRPTIDIDKMEQWGLDHLVDVTRVVYYAYYDMSYTSECSVVSRELMTSTESCFDLPVLDECGNEISCTGPWTGILTDDGGEPDGSDMPFAASFIAAAADKTGFISVDMIVYLNSILGLNKVVGYSEVDEDGEPTDDAINYYLFPEYFNFNTVSGYHRGETFLHRGEVETTGGNGNPSTYNGLVLVLTPAATNGMWQESQVSILDNVYFQGVETTWNIDTYTFIDGVDDIYGFTQMADDDLGVINFIHTFQIPERR